ncbi:hypothetical protein BDV06DRAFT_219171 [Aspergillus oleicola]
MRIISLLSLLSTVRIAVGELYTTRQLYQLAPGTQISSLAQRGLSWYTRFTCLDSPEVMEVDPSHQHSGPRIIHTFSNATGTTGIAEIVADTYAVLTLKEDAGGSSVSLWTLEASNVGTTATKVIDKIVDGDTQLQVGHLDGLAAVSPSILFASDPRNGGIYRFNLSSGMAKKFLDSLPFGPGISGLQYKVPYLYFTHSLDGVFGRIPFDTTGELTGSPEVLASGDILVGAKDFALADWTDAAFIVNFEKGTVVRVDIGDEVAEVVVEGIGAPTSAAFGASGGLYVGTAGHGGDGASIWSVVVPDERFI